MNKIKKRFDYLFERMSKADISLNKPLFYEELDKAIEEAIEEEKMKIRNAWENLNIVGTASVGSAIGLLVRNSWGETDSMQVNKKLFKEFLMSLQKGKKI